mgnify:CR=1 FL=1
MTLTEIFASWLVVAGFILAVMIFRGLLPHSLVKTEGPTYRLSAGINLIIVAYVARSFYWEVVPVALRFVHPSAWASWYGYTGLAINMLFSLLFIRGLSHLLILLWLLIPSEDRKDWTIWSAPWYPNHNYFTRLSQRLRLRWRSKSGQRKTKS